MDCALDHGVELVGGLGGMHVVAFSLSVLFGSGPVHEDEVEWSECGDAGGDDDDVVFDPDGG